MQNTISVIIPAYNASRTIQRAIRSVICQTCQPIEILVIDDGSTDDTAIKTKDCGNLVRYIYQENAGAAAARNTGANFAQGKWLAFLDADDEWHPQKLEIQMKFVDCQSKVVLLTNVPTIIRSDQEAEFGAVNQSPHYFVWEQKAFLRRNKIHTSSALILKTAYEAVGGCDTSLLNAQDRDLWLKLLYIGTGICIQEPLTRYYHLSTSLSKNLVRRFQCDMIIIDKWDHRKQDSLDIYQSIPSKVFVKIKYAVLFSIVFKLLRFHYKMEAKQFWQKLYKFHKEEYPFLPCPPWWVFKLLISLERLRQRWKYGK